MRLKKTVTTTFDVEEYKIYELSLGGGVRLYNCITNYLMEKLNEGDRHKVDHMSALLIFTIDIDEFSKFQNVGKETVKRFIEVKNELIDLIKENKVCLVRI